MATNPSNSTPPQDDAEQLAELVARATELFGPLTDEQLAELAALTPEEAAELLAHDSAPEPATDTAGIVIDANGTAWEDTEATRNERAAS